MFSMAYFKYFRVLNGQAIFDLFFCFCFAKLQLIDSIIMVQNGATLFVKIMLLVLGSTRFRHMCVITGYF